MGVSCHSADGFSASILKECVRTVLYLLSILFALSFETSCMPSPWRSALVKPLVTANYRPVSLDLIASKVCERIVHEEDLRFALENHLWPDFQHCIFPGCSVVYNLLECLNSWKKSLNGSHPVHVIYMDFS